MGGEPQAKPSEAALITRFKRVLSMQSGVTGLVVRIRDRKELLRETCQLAITVGGYAAAVASTKVPDVAAMQPVAWSGIDDKVAEDLRACVADAAALESSVIGTVIKTGKEVVCSRLDAVMTHIGVQRFVVLPLVVDKIVIGVLVLSAPESTSFGPEEMEMLREVAASLSFGLQYIQRDTTVRFLSHFHPKTGLASRPLFCERVQRLADPAKQGSRCTVVVMDIERLSIINDAFGRRTGDLLLRQVADRLKRVYPETDQIGHFGGGTFALVRPQSNRTAIEIRTAGRRQEKTLFGEPYQVEGHSIHVTVRTGFALFPEDAADATSLVQHAEAAVHDARATGGKHVRYSSKTCLEGVARLAMEQRLRLALARREFELFYQPKVNVVTRRIQGAEALIRWRSPEDGLVFPGAFLAVLESAGLTAQVGDWVVGKAALDCQRWLSEGLPPIRVAINIAPTHLRHPDFVRDFLRVVEPWATRTSGLDVEITEGVLQEDSIAEISALKLLREAGVRIAVDDFGTGYSSLRRLAGLPIDTLKIDKQFIADSANAVGASLVKTIITLARTFKMSTVAEGVEKQEQLDLLRHMGCDQSQGYLHSPAVTAEEFGLLLRHGKGRLIHPAQEEEPVETQASSPPDRKTGAL